MRTGGTGRGDTRLVFGGIGGGTFVGWYTFGMSGGGVGMQANASSVSSSLPLPRIASKYSNNR